MLTTKQHAKAGTTEFRSVFLIDVPDDYPEVVAVEDSTTPEIARSRCEEAILAGRATMAEVYEEQYRAVEYHDSHYGFIRDAEIRRVSSQFGWLGEDGTVQWDPAQPVDD